MKKNLSVILLFLSFSVFSQQAVRFDIADALGLKTLELNYEYYVSEQSSFGISALFNFEGRGADFRYNEERMITPFFRHYFSTEANWNFFG